MLHRIIPAVSLLALVGCQPYYPYPQYSAYGYYPGRPVVSVAAPPTEMELNAQRAGVAPGLAATPPALIGGPFRDAGAQPGELGFAAGDPVRRTAVANYANRHVEWLTLKNGGILVYERLDTGAVTGPSDIELLRSDLDWPAFRQRGIGFDAARLETVGPFTYLAQSSPMYNCVIFRGKLTQAGASLTRQAYGNVCYAKAAKDLAGVRAEMVDILSHVRVGDGATRVASAAQAAPAPLAVAARLPGEASTGGGLAVAIEQCRSRVSFSGTPALMDLPGVPAATRFIETLQIATFDDTPELGKELRYEARQNTGDVLLVGRNFFRRCSLSVKATAASDADQAKARKFIASVGASTAEAAAPAASAAEAAAAGSTQQPVISTAEKPETPPTPAPRQPVTEAKVDSAKPAEATVQPAVEQTTSGDATVTRLRRLKMLKEQQLITPDEYDAKRKGIIDAL